MPCRASDYPLSLSKSTKLWYNCIMKAKEVSTSRFIRDYVGKQDITEPLFITHRELPYCYVYPVDMIIAGRIDNAPIFKAEPTNEKVLQPEDETAKRQGQCQVCYEFAPLKFGYVVGPHGMIGRWLCSECLSKGQNNKDGFGPSDMISANKGHKFYG